MSRSTKMSLFGNHPRISVVFSSLVFLTINAFWYSYQKVTLLSGATSALHRRFKAWILGKKYALLANTRQGPCATASNRSSLPLRTYFRLPADESRGPLPFCFYSHPTSLVKWLRLTFLFKRTRVRLRIRSFFYSRWPTESCIGRLRRGSYLGDH